MPADTVKQSLAETAANHIRHLILTGRLIAGTHLQEVQLARRLGMSRTPVREALSILSQERLLEPGPKRGFKVRGFCGAEIRDALEVRATLEGAACRLLGERGMPASVRDTLRGAVIEGDKLLAVDAFGPEDLVQWMGINFRFHDTIIESSENRMLIALCRQAQNMPMASAQHLYRLHRKEMGFQRQLVQRAALDHRLIFEALEERQSYRVEALMREHIWFSARATKMRLQDRDVSNADYLNEPDVLASILPIAR